MGLSIAIPVYNFASFLPATLHSILDQTHGRQIEVVVTDGASTDDTPAVMERLCARYANLRYNRLATKGGIDKDMALAVAATSGDYVWLFSGDDIMHADALGIMREKISSGDDIYLCRHMECTRWMEPVLDYPVLTPDVPEVFELSDPDHRRIYFSRAQNSEAFFSFCGGLVVRRQTWDRKPFDPSWDGTCWGHVARLFSVLDDGLRVNYLGRHLLSRRGDNDSFSKNGLVERLRIQVDGFHDIINAKFGPRSVEAREMRRAIRNEFHPAVVLLLKLLTIAYPQREDRSTLDRIVTRAYSDLTRSCLEVRREYKTISYDEIKAMHPALCASYLEPEAHQAAQQCAREAYEGRLASEAGIDASSLQTA